MFTLKRFALFSQKPMPSCIFQQNNYLKSQIKHFLRKILIMKKTVLFASALLITAQASAAQRELARAESRLSEESILVELNLDDNEGILDDLPSAKSQVRFHEKLQTILVDHLNAKKLHSRSPDGSHDKHIALQKLNTLKEALRDLVTANSTIIKPHLKRDLEALLVHPSDCSACPSCSPHSS